MLGTELYTTLCLHEGVQGFRTSPGSPCFSLFPSLSLSLVFNYILFIVLLVCFFLFFFFFLGIGFLYVTTLAVLELAL